MKLNPTPEILLSLPIFINVILLASATHPETEVDTHNRQVRSYNALIPPLFPPDAKRRHARSLSSNELWDKNEFEENISENSSDKTKGEIRSDEELSEEGRVRSVRSADLIPPLFPPPGSKRSKRSALIPPLFPPPEKLRMERSAPHDLNNHRASTGGSSKHRAARSVDSQAFIPPLFPPRAGKRSMHSRQQSAFIPPLFPPSEGKRSVDSRAYSAFIPPLFPPTGGKRSVDSQTYSAFIPPLFPPTGGKRSVDSPAYSAFIPPLFPPSEGKRSVDSREYSALIPPLFPPSEGKRSSPASSSVRSLPEAQEGSLSKGLIHLLQLSARSRLQARDKRSSDSAVIPPLFPPSKGIVRRRLPRSVDAISDRQREGHYARDDLETVADMSGKMSVWAVSIATVSLVLVAVIAVVTALVVITKLSVLSDCHARNKLPI